MDGEVPAPVEAQKTPESQQIGTFEASSSQPNASEPESKKRKLAAHDDNAVPQDAPSTNPRLAALATKKTNLESKLADLRSQRAALAAGFKLPSGLEMTREWSDEQKSEQAVVTANGVIKDHIALLHSYNEIKDVGQGLMGLVAEKRGVRVATIMDENGITVKD